MLRQSSHDLALEQHVARRWVQESRQQVDQRGLARSVGADQRMAGAGPHAQVHVVGGDEAAEAFDQPAGLQHRAHRRLRDRRRAARRKPPTIPSRANRTINTSNMPSQNCQYCGLRSDNRWRAVMNTMAPSSAPYRLPAPPSTSISSSSAERGNASTSTATMRKMGSSGEERKPYDAMGGRYLRSKRTVVPPAEIVSAGENPSSSRR